MWVLWICPVKKKQNTGARRKLPQQDFTRLLSSVYSRQTLKAVGKTQTKVLLVVLHSGQLIAFVLTSASWHLGNAGGAQVYCKMRSWRTLQMSLLQGPVWNANCSHENRAEGLVSLDIGGTLKRDFVKNTVFRYSKVVFFSLERKSGIHSKFHVNLWGRYVWRHAHLSFADVSGKRRRTFIEYPNYAKISKQNRASIPIEVALQFNLCHNSCPWRQRLK